MIWGGSPAEIVKAAEEKKIIIIVSEDILREINETLAYPRLRRVYEDAGVSKRELVETILRIGRLVEAKVRVKIVKKDPADNMFLECALAGEADYLVSGDKHLLGVENFGRTRILPVSEFVKILGKGKPTKR